MYTLTLITLITQGIQQRRRKACIYTSHSFTNTSDNPNNSNHLNNPDNAYVANQGEEGEKTHIHTYIQYRHTYIHTYTVHRL